MKPTVSGIMSLVFVVEIIQIHSVKHALILMPLSLLESAFINDSLHWFPAFPFFVFFLYFLTFILLFSVSYSVDITMHQLHRGNTLKMSAEKHLRLTWSKATKCNDWNELASPVSYISLYIMYLQVAHTLMLLLTFWLVCNELYNFFLCGMIYF